MVAEISNAADRFFFFVIFGHYLPFYPPSSPKNENMNKKKMKKTPGNVIILH